jgi:CBS domain-containing protein
MAGSAITSPLTNVTLADPGGVASQLSPFATVLLWLGPINLLLGVFNLIPGFPLDGGRLLRSMLWAITENLRQATRWATWVGQAVAWLMIMSGIAMIFGVEVPLFGTGFVSGLWLAFIGWFLNTAASQSYQKVVVDDILEDVPVSRLMRKDPPTVSANSSVTSLVHDHMMGTDEHAFPVMADGRMVGLVTLEDVRSVSRDEWETIPIRNIMTPIEELSTLSPDEEADDALRQLQRKDVRQLPIIDTGGILTGLLRRRDILKWLQLQGDIT